MNCNCVGLLHHPFWLQRLESINIFRGKINLNCNCVGLLHHPFWLLAQIIFEFWVVYGQYINDVPVSEIEPRCCFFPFESKDCMKSASYEYRKMSAKSGVPIGMPTVCWKTFPAKTRRYCKLETQASWWCHFQSTCF